ncbi:MAG: hypothetical protein ACJAXJ_004054 [Colwellia sp.]|jgi:hypothetical protein
MSDLLPNGTPLGLCDSNGVEFKSGSIVRAGTCNEDTHGNWVDYEIKLQGTTPILVYIKSEKGQVLPTGHTGCPLSNFYDVEMFVFSKNSMSLRPDEDLFIQNN